MFALQILLRPAFRNPEGVRRVRRVLEGLGLTVSGAGAATISARGDSATVARVFAGESETLLQAAASGDRFLAIPPALSSCVEAIAVAPRHEFMEGT